MSDDWDDYGGAKPPSKLALALLVLAALLFLGWCAVLVGAWAIGGGW